MPEPTISDLPQAEKPKVSKVIDRRDHFHKGAKEVKADLESDKSDTTFEERRAKTSSYFTENRTDLAGAFNTADASFDTVPLFKEGNKEEIKISEMRHSVKGLVEHVREGVVISAEDAGKLEKYLLNKAKLRNAENVIAAYEGGAPNIDEHKYDLYLKTVGLLRKRSEDLRPE